MIRKNDSYRGETIKALIVLKPRSRTSESLVARADVHVQVPRVAEFVHELPEPLSGKTQWRQLQEREDALHPVMHSSNKLPQEK